MGEDKNAKKLSVVINVFYYGLTVLGVVLGVRLFFRFLLPAVYPFIIAYAAALGLNPLMRWLEKRMGIPKKVGAFLLVTLTVAGLFGAIYLVVQRAAEEIGRLADRIANMSPEETAPIKERINGIILHLPGFDSQEDLTAFWQNAEEKAESFFANSLPSLQSALDMFGGVVDGVFDFVLAFFVTVVACYYLTVDRARVAGLVYGLFPKSMESKLRGMRNELFSTLGKYLKAYGIIILITFTELFVALTVLRIDYALLIAAVTALIDILPVLGTGCILVPWALWCLFVTGDIYRGVGLLISYGAITVIRQIIEPKIVGSYIGLHPLATLLAMFVGLKLFGIMGLLLLPMAVLVARNIGEKYKEM